MKQLSDFLHTTYYTPIVLFVVALSTGIVGYYNKDKFRILRPFLLYTLLSAVQILLCFVLLAGNIALENQINTASVYLFSIAEFIIIYEFLSKLITSKTMRMTMKFLGILFIVVAIFSWLENFSKTIPPIFNIINAICIAIPCAYYFYETFTKPPVVILSHQPAFWIIAGFLFMFICTLPFYLLQDYIQKYMLSLFRQANVINNVYYSLLFLLISKAFLCKRETVKL